MTERGRLVMARAAELLTVKEFAAMFRLHERSVYRRIWAGRQPGAVRCGGQWRIDACVVLSNSHQEPDSAH